MMAQQRSAHLIDGLPAVRGKLDADASLARFTWFKVGGPAEVLFRPADTDDLSAFLCDLPEGIPITVMGTASNLLVRDGGVEGVVIRLGRGFSEIEVTGDCIRAGASAVDLNVARQARQAELTGLEFLSGIPGTIGGALRMNAGAYECEVKDIFDHALALDGNGKRHRLSAEDMGFSYRHVTVPSDWIFVEATFRGKPGTRDVIAQRMDEIRKQREATQPVRTPTGGSTFKNTVTAKAWELVDQAGCRGLKRGGAMVSEQHCNFLINTGGATASDIEGLGEEVRRRVQQTSGVVLEWEIQRIGRPLMGGAKK